MENQNGLNVMENTSGQGSTAFVPENIAKRFNWGAFFFTFIWLFWYGQIGFGILSLILYIISHFSILLALFSLGFSIFFGIKGNAWAWQERHYDSFDEFHKVQRKWATVGVFICCIIFILGFIMGILGSAPTFVRVNKLAESKVLIRKSAEYLDSIANSSHACNYMDHVTSNGLAKCFSTRLNPDMATLNQNTIKLADGMTWVFYGDGKCNKQNKCKVTLKLPEHLKEYDKGFILYLNLDDYKYIMINTDEINRLQNLQNEDFE